MRIDEAYDALEAMELEESFKDFTNQGWEIVKKFRDLDDGRMHVIAKRGNTIMPPYCIGLGYNEMSGSWDQGRYDYASVEDAEDDLKNYWKYNVEEITGDSVVEEEYDFPAMEDKIRELDEAMSEEDAIDSALIASAYKKLVARSNAKLTADEEAVLAKYNLKPQYKSPSDSYGWHSKEGDIKNQFDKSVVRDAHYTKYDRDVNRLKTEVKPQVNLADRARKDMERGERRNELDTANRGVLMQKGATRYGADKYEIPPTLDAENEHGEKEAHVYWNDDVRRETNRHPELTKERQAQANKMYKPVADMKKALADKRANQDRLDRVEKNYADDVEYANRSFKDRMKDAEDRKKFDSEEGQKGLADAQAAINKLLKKEDLENLTKAEWQLNEEVVDETLANGTTDTRESQILDNVFAYLRDLKGDEEFTTFAKDVLKLTDNELVSFCNLGVNESLEEEVSPVEE